MLEEKDNIFMRRALQLARRGLGNVSPNPMVGAVIVSKSGRIIGEGYHRRFGDVHAEVNAINSIRAEDRALLPESTLYVTLEPCSHFGKTPPCSNLLIENKLRRVVIATLDPFVKVNGRGAGILRNAGIEVESGVLEHEARSLNARFFIAHTLHRPFIFLKWAQSREGYFSVRYKDIEAPANERCSAQARFSDNIGLTLMHRLRANHDAIAVGSGTALADQPQLTVREWHGRNPQKIIFDRRGRIGSPTPEIREFLDILYNEGYTSIMVEGGASVLKWFIDAGLWDLARIEVCPTRNIRPVNGVADLWDTPVIAPTISRIPDKTVSTGTNSIYYYYNNIYVNDYFIENAL